MKNRLELKSTIIKINSYFNDKKNLLVFLLLLLGVLIPVFSGSDTFNFWSRLYNILTDPFYNMMLFFGIGICVINVIVESFRSYDVIIRCQNIKNTYNKFKKDIIIFTIFLMFIALLLAVAGSIFLSLGDYKMLYHPIYKIPMVVYILLFLLRSVIIACIMNCIVFDIFLKFNNIITALFVMINGLLFFSTTSSSIINHFYNTPILYQAYLKQIYYNSLLLETISSILEILLLLIIERGIYLFIIKKKSDLK